MVVLQRCSNSGLYHYSLILDDYNLKSRYMMAKKLRDYFWWNFSNSTLFFSFSLSFPVGNFFFGKKNWRVIIICFVFSTNRGGGNFVLGGDSHNWIIILTNFLDLTFFSQIFLYKKQFLWMMLYGDSKESGNFLS